LPVRAVVLDFTLARVPVFDQPHGRRIAEIEATAFPRNAARPDGRGQGVAVYDENGGALMIALPGGGTGWISKAAALTSARACTGTAPPKSVRDRGGAVARGAGDVAC
jgi:hypothetical protein